MVATFTAPQAARAADANNWSAGHIIDDQVFNNKDAMSVVDIQNFLNSKVPTCDTNHAAGPSNQGAQPPWTCLKNYYENTSTHANNLNGAAVPAGAISAAQIIYNYGQQFNINPQVILVTLQKENGLITDTWPYPWQFRTAMGFACPDTSACDPAYYGFAQQVYQGARHLRNFADGLNNANWFTPYTVGVRSIQYNPNAGCGAGNVNIVNGATAALYSYTPYQPNGIALTNLYGSGDSCSAYGNRNFWRDFTDWFGSTYTVTYSATFMGQSSYPTILAGTQTTAYFLYKNSGAGTWYDDSSIGSAPAGNSPMHLATSHPLNRPSVFGSAWVGGNNRPAVQFTTVYEANGSTLATNQHTVLSGQIVKISFTLSAPLNQAPGTYREFFMPIREGTSDGGINDPWTFLDVTVTAPTYSAQYSSESGSFNLFQSTSTTGFFSYKNTGNQPWYDNTSIGSAPAGNYPMHLATSHPLGRGSAFGSTWGGDQNRAAVQFSAVYEADGTTLAASQHIVQPGQIGKMSFGINVGANLAPGTYREYFMPIREGTSDGGMNDPGTYMDIVVNRATFSDSFITQSAYPSIARGAQSTVFFSYKNTGNQPWYDNTSIGGAPAGNFPMHLATSHPLGHSSALGATWGGDQNRAALQFGAVYEADGSTPAASQHIVQPGQIAKMSFVLSAPSNLATGVYREFFMPIREGTADGGMNDPWTFLDVTVTP